MNEIVVTERSYLSSLGALLTAFVRPLVADYKSGKPQFGGGVLGVMNEAGDGAAMSVFMSRLEHIVTLNSKLQTDLEARLEQWTAAPMDSGGNAPMCTCGDVFANYAPLFNMYDEYSSSYEFATKTLVDREKSDAKLAKFLEEQSTQYAGVLRQQTILSLLIMPIQRVPRYLLLLKEMLKHTAEDHPDHALVEKAIQTISQVASHINEHIRERENMVALREIDHELGGSEQLTDNPSRVFLMRGDLIKRSRKSDSDYHVWLFSDILLYQKKAGVYGKPPKRIEVRTLTVIDVPDTDGERAFAFDLRSQSKSFRVFASDSQEKDRWVRAVQDAIEQATGGRILNAKDAAPVWEQDTSACTVCEAHFTFIFRRHHCRACGRCVCDKCSKNRMLLRNVDEQKEVRVCQPCFDTLSGPSNSAAKRHALNAALVNASASSSFRRGSAPTVSASSPSMPKLGQVGMGGSKRNQSEANVMLSPRAAAMHAGIVDHKQISSISQEMAERRRQREHHYQKQSDSPSVTPARDATGSSESSSMSSPLPPSRVASSVSSSPLSKSLSMPRAGVDAVDHQPITKSLSMPRGADVNQPVKASPPMGDKVAPISAPMAKKRNQDELTTPPSKAATPANVTPPVAATKAAEIVKTTPVAPTKAAETVAGTSIDEAVKTSPEREAMSEVLQQIRREVPLEAPKPLGMHELPKPLPVARIASPAQLSPVNSPKIGVLKGLAAAGEIAATPSPLSSTAATPSSFSSASPTTPGDSPAALVAPISKPPPPGRRPSGSGLHSASTVPSPLTKESSDSSMGPPSKKSPSVPDRGSSVASTKAPPSGVPAATQGEVSGQGGADESGEVKPSPPPLPKRRPSSTGSSRALVRTESNQSASQRSERADSQSSELFDIL